MIIDMMVKLRDSGILDLLSIALSTLIPLIILYTTLKHSKEQFGLQLKQQLKEHLENIEKMEYQHKEIMQQQSECNRIAAMPYLIIDKSDITISKENNTIYFNIPFKNIGNGTAIKLTGKYLSNLSEAYLSPMCETLSSVYGCASPFDYETDVLKANDISYIMLYQLLIKPNTPVNCDEVTFKILFKDMYYNQYEQQFMFLFNNNTLDGSIYIDRVSVKPPEVCEK